MIRRPFFALLGLGAGLALGVWAVRKVDAAQRALTPEELSRNANARVGAVGERLNEALAAGRAAAAAREAELRATHRPRIPGAVGDPASPGAVGDPFPPDAAGER